MFYIKGFFRKCDQIRSFLRIWSHLLKKPLIENFIFCAVFLVVWYMPNWCRLSIDLQEQKRHNRNILKNCFLYCISSYHKTELLFHSACLRDLDHSSLSYLLPRYDINFRSSHRMCTIKKVFLKMS